MKDFFCRLFTPWSAGAQFDAPEAFYGFLLGRDKLLGTLRNLCFGIALVLLVIYAFATGLITCNASRIDIWLDPFNEEWMRDKGYQIRQSLLRVVWRILIRIL